MQKVSDIKLQKLGKFLLILNIKHFIFSSYVKSNIFMQFKHKSAMKIYLSFKKLFGEFLKRSHLKILPSLTTKVLIK